MIRTEIEALKLSIANQIDMAEQELSMADDEVRQWEGELEDLDNALEKLNEMKADDE